MQVHYHRPENVPIPETGALFSIEVALHKNIATVMLDTTGDSLFKRGYRVDKGGAPIKENMAAAIIMLTNWRANMTRPFVDPTCGSGTFCIEAALIGMNIAPGFNRDFALKHGLGLKMRYSKKFEMMRKAKQIMTQNLIFLGLMLMVE
jgi:putative N6-adenine-specific DNA methylase